MKLSRLRFNFGFLLEAEHGTSRRIELDYPDIRVSEDVVLAPLRGTLTVTRTGEGIYLEGDLQSKLIAQCVRCLEDAEVPIDIRLDELYYYPPQTAPKGEPFIGEDGFVDLSPIVRDMALLGVPIKVLCRPDCQGLCQECGANLNLGDCGCVDDRIDPRLAALQQLLKDRDN
jgi:uncharacterized protein